MEIDGPFSRGEGRGPSAGPVFCANMVGADVTEGCNSDTAGEWRAEYVRLCRPDKYDGRRDQGIIDEFVTSLRDYFASHRGSEEQKILMASRLLEGEAREWWRRSRGQAHLPEGITTLDAFMRALVAHFTPVYAKEQATSELSKLKQGKLSIASYIDKFQSLAQRSHSVDPALMYQWFISGLSPSARQLAASYSVYHDMSGTPTGLPEMMHYLRCLDAQGAFSAEWRAKGEILRDDCPDFEPMDIGATGASPFKPQRSDRKGTFTERPPSSQFRKRQQQKVCFCCEKPGHFVRDCKLLQEVKESLRQERARQRKPAHGHREVQPGNSPTPLRTAAQGGGPRGKASH